MAHHLDPRFLGGLFKSSNSNTSCARPETNDIGDVLPIGITVQELLFYTTLACLGVTTISSFVLILRHAAHYTKPKEQKQQIRIAVLPIVYSIISLLSIRFYQDSIYLKPLTQVYEAFCVTALFSLFIEYLCPEEDLRLAYFQNLRIEDKKGNALPNGGIRWINVGSTRKAWIMVFQYPVTKTLSAVVEIATQAGGVYCVNSLSPKYAHIWLLLIDIFIIGGALSAVFKLYRRCRSDFKETNRAFGKLITFKGIVLLQFLQQILFGFLNGRLFHANNTLTYNDIYYGIPMMLTAIEALLSSVIFHWSYSNRDYLQPFARSESLLGIFEAIISAINVSDIVASIWTACRGGPFASYLKYSSPLESSRSSSRVELRPMHQDETMQS
ncbi:organic solute transporter Ostalpha domain-containing protein [Trichoderma chlorosporum]